MYNQMKISTLLTVFVAFSLIASILLMLMDNSNTFAQLQQQQQQQPGLRYLDVKVTSPTHAQQVPIDSITIFGISTDDASTDCEVYANRNGLSPFQRVSATGPGGPNDYSNWTFTYVAPQASITEGNTNELTVKLSCLNNPANLTVFYTVNVTGMSSNTTGSTVASPSATTNVTSDFGPLSTLPLFDPTIPQTGSRPTIPDQTESDIDDSEESERRGGDDAAAASDDADAASDDDDADADADAAASDDADAAASDDADAAASDDADAAASDDADAASDNSDDSG
jgi:hypothetical protein